MSQFQLIPYDRIRDYFVDQLHLPVSAGSIFNCNQEALDLLAGFEDRVKTELASSGVAHADETGINISGERHWLNCRPNDDWTFYDAHKKRGTLAMNEMGILPIFKGILCHDHWKPHFTYDCTHALCNAYHVRELARACEQDGQKWAKKMKELLETIHCNVIDAGGVLDTHESQRCRLTYRAILRQGERECPEPAKPKKGTRGQVKKTKSRNLLERLRDFEQNTLRFMDHADVPFSNNLGERDILMTKVQQKISGCFRSMTGARIFCRIRSYLSTCQKHRVKSSQALNLLFNGKLPEILM